MKQDGEMMYEKRRIFKNHHDLLRLLALALAHPLPAGFGRERVPLNRDIVQSPLNVPNTFRCRSRSPLLALSPMEQFKMQQQQLANRRQHRLEIEEAANAPPSEEVVKWKAEVDEYVQRHAAPFRVFNEHLFPRNEYKKRNGLSREDGYMPFLRRGEEPPQDYAYGEFPMFFFGKLVDRACELVGVGSDRRNTVLADIGSGAGRLSLWAASTSAWQRVVGIEYLPALAKAGSSMLHRMRQDFPELLLTHDVQLIEGSWDDPLDAFADIDIAFVYSTALSTNDDGILENLSSALRQRLKLGCMVVTTEYMLDPADFEVVEKIERENFDPEMGAKSTGFIHRKISAGERDVAATGVERKSPQVPAAPLAGDDDFRTREASLFDDLDDFRKREASLLDDFEALR